MSWYMFGSWTSICKYCFIYWWTYVVLARTSLNNWWGDLGFTQTMLRRSWRYV
jgi:hypothetical protein